MFKNENKYSIADVSDDRVYAFDDYIQLPEGAPDLLVKFLSKGKAGVDKKRKMKTYGKHSVREYWLVDPTKKTLQLFENQAGKMVELEELCIGQRLESKVLVGLHLEVVELFS